MLRLDAGSAVPIWRQIEDEVRRLIVTGRLPLGTMAPSVRDLAKELQVNPATVSRAYQSLVDQGHLTVRRGEGTFIAEVIPLPSRAEQRRVLTQSAESFVTAALGAGIEETAAIAAIRRAFRRLRARKSA